MLGVAGTCSEVVTRALMGVAGQLQRNVEKSVLKGKRDGNLGSVTNSERERFLSERQNLHDYLEREARRALQGECISQRRLSEAEVEMDRKSWERRNSDMASYETNRQLVAQQMEL